METFSKSLANSAIDVIESEMKAYGITQTTAIARHKLSSNTISSLRKLVNRPLHIRKKSSSIIMRTKWSIEILKGNENIQSVAKKTGYSRRTVNKWYLDYLRGLACNARSSVAFKRI